MNAKAHKEFIEFLQSHDDTGTSRIAFKLGEYAYTELVNWLSMEHAEFSSHLDNEAQLLLVLLILEASK